MNPANPAGKRFKWTVQFTISEEWVADGFDLTEERALMMLAKELEWAHIDLELGAKIIKAPSPKSIRVAQGYEEAE